MSSGRVYKLSQSLGKYIPYIIAALFSVAFFVVVLVLLGQNPLLALISLIRSSLGSGYSVGNTLTYMSMLLLASIAFLVGFSGGFINIGVEGQLYMGAIFAYIVSRQFGSLPFPLPLLLALISSIAGGIVWIAIPLFLKVSFKINEVFVTMILNFISPLIVSWGVTGPFRDPRVSHPQSLPIPSSAWIPKIPSINLQLGFILSVAIAVLIYLLLYFTTLGLYIRAVGSNPQASRASGIDPKIIMIIVGLLSGGMAGIIGFIEVNGNSHLLMENFSMGWGYLGIAVAVLGNFHPLGALVASFFYSVLISGGRGLEIYMGLPIEISFVLQVTIVLVAIIVKTFLTERVK
jgi:ABC-type uncharacterized transport system permease subunit